MKTTLLITLNAALLFLLVVLAAEGYVAPVFDDRTYMTHGIAALGAFGVALSLRWFWGGLSPRWAMRWSLFLAGQLVAFGLLGTVIGYKMALGGVSAATAADVSAVTPMVSALLSGQATAINTTIVGILFSCWLLWNRMFIWWGRAE
jgi:hypothetical protein